LEKIKSHSHIFHHWDILVDLEYFDFIW